jgi:hypothetical protein
MQQLVASAQRQDAPQLTHLVASLVGLQDDGSSVIILHLGALDHLVGHVNVLGVVLVVVDLRNRHVTRARARLRFLKTCQVTCAPAGELLSASTDAKPSGF